MDFEDKFQAGLDAARMQIEMLAEAAACQGKTLAPEQIKWAFWLMNFHAGELQRSRGCLIYADNGEIKWLPKA